MSRENDYLLFCININATNEDYSGFTDRQRSQYFWLAYVISLLMLLVFVMFFSLGIGIFINVQLLGLSAIAVFFFNLALVLTGRKGFIYCEDEVEGNTLHVESGINKPRYYFRK